MCIRDRYCVCEQYLSYRDTYLVNHPGIDVSAAWVNARVPAAYRTRVAAKESEVAAFASANADYAAFAAYRNAADIVANYIATDPGASQYASRVARFVAVLVGGLWQCWTTLQMT